MFSVVRASDMSSPIVMRALVELCLTAFGSSGTTECHATGLSTLRLLSFSTLELHWLDVLFRLQSSEEKLMVFNFPFWDDAFVMSPKNPGNSLERIGLEAWTQAKIMPMLV